MTDEGAEVESTACSGSETLDPLLRNQQPAIGQNVSMSKLNACAPEFVPLRPPGVAPSPPPPSPPGIVHMFHTPHFHLPIHMVPVPNHQHRSHPHQQQYLQARNHGHSNHSRATSHPHHHNFVPAPPPHNSLRKIQADDDGELKADRPLSDDAQHKLLNQVEYYFSDLNLATTDHLMKFISKDPEGFVPISVVASFRKVKVANISNSQLAVILRKSSKLMVSEVGEKVKRILPVNESDMEELQCRIVVAENLPEDHCHQNLMKIFSSVGSVNNIRTCPPQASPTSATSRIVKTDGIYFSNKLHAFVEYETVEMAEKAVVELNEAGNWRNGLRVKLMLKRNAKLRVKRGQDGEDEEASSSEQADDSSEQPDVTIYEAEEKEISEKKGRAKSRGKGRGRGQRVATVTPAVNDMTASGKQHPPRTPDGTKGFSAGRGKPLPSPIG